MTPAKAIVVFILGGTVLGGAISLGGCLTSTKPAETAVTPSSFHVRQTGRIANPALIEASGMACARGETDLLWLVNDGGHPAVLFAVRSDGDDQGMVNVEGAVNTDWEDLAAFEWEGRPYILIADVGDNRAKRDFVRMYVVPEPERAPAGGFPAHVAVAWQFDFRYEDGPRDCEGVGVDTRNGRILLITKRTTPPQLYSLPLRPPAEGIATARKIGTVPRIPPPTSQDLVANPRFGALFAQPTAMDIRGDNRLAMVLTYKDAYLFPRHAGEGWTSALARQPLRVPLPALKQKESACLTPGGHRLYVTTEKRPTPLLVVDLGPIP